MIFITLGHVVHNKALWFANHENVVPIKETCAAYTKRGYASTGKYWAFKETPEHVLHNKALWGNTVTQCAQMLNICKFNA